MNRENLNNLTNEIWKGAIKLRNKFKAYEYQGIILPMIMIRRIECVLIEKREEIKEKILQENLNLSEQELYKKIKLREKTFLNFYNKSDWTLSKILKESELQVENNFRDYLNQFSENIIDIIDHFNYKQKITEMVKANRLKSIIELVVNEDFSPKRLSNLEMGYVYEELLQKFTQDDAKDTGEHFTPREIIKIMVDLMDINFDVNSKKSISIYDPACGTGGMLSVAKEFLMENIEDSKSLKEANELILLSGQEYLPQNYAVCKADMILKGDTEAEITLGNSLIEDISSSRERGDKHFHKKFDYMISNPPFGVNWGEYKSQVEDLQSRVYSWGLSPTNDGSLLFLSNMIYKMKDVEDGGSKIAILFNGSPLSNGDAGSGESEIRRNIIENDMLDVIVMLPDQMFYNTGIYTYIWIITNTKSKNRKGKVQIINAREQYVNEQKSFGQKRHKITPTNRDWISEQYRLFENNEYSKIFNNFDFAYHKVKIVFWQKDENGESMYVDESFDVGLTNGNVKKKWDLYGDMEFTLSISTKENEEFNVELVYDNSKSFEVLLMDILRAKKSELKEMDDKELKKYLKECIVSASYRHKHLIEDYEYIAYGEDIEEYLKKELECEIISWEVNKTSNKKTMNDEVLGYEILPNKYFYTYVEPEKSEELLNTFWELEGRVEEILQEMRNDK